MIATDKLQLLQKCLNKMFQYYSVSTNTACITECGMINEDQIIWHLCKLFNISKHFTILNVITETMF